MTLGHGAKAALKAKPILWAVVACFVLETGMNATFGYGLSPNFWKGLLYGGVFIALAFLAAWTCVELFAARGNDAAAWGKRFAFGLPFLALLIVSQASGWSVVGAITADGGVKRDSEATTHDVAKDKLRLYRAEREQLLIKRPIAAIEAELSLELRKTSRAFPDGDGPKALALKAELATARRAAELEETLIPQAMQAVATAPQVAVGSPHLAVLKAMFGGSDRDITFWWSVFLVGVIGFFANFGFALAGVGQERAPAREPEPFVDEWGWGGPRRIGFEATRAAGESFAGEPERPDNRRDAPGALGAMPPRASGYVASDRLRVALSPASGESAGVGAASPASVVHGAPVTPQQHMHAAPINIHFQGPPAVAAGQGQVPKLAPPDRSPAERVAPGADTSGASGRLPAGPSPAPSTVPPLETGAPVDRSYINALTDQLLLFKAKELEAMPGGIVSGDDMYARYVHWAGARVISRAAFLQFFGALTGTPSEALAGEVHFFDVAVRGAHLRLVEVG